MEKVIKKVRVSVNGVWQHIPETQLIKRVIGVDEEGKNIYGDYYTHYNSDMTVSTVAETIDKQDKFRKDREPFFALIDKYQGVLIYNDLTPEQQTELSVYRQELKDATTNWVMPDTPIWMK